jgi:hypothetical protein
MSRDGIDANVRWFLLNLVLRQLHELIQADFAKNHLKALKCFVEVDLLKCDRLLSQL